MRDRKDLTRWYVDQCVRGNATTYMDRVKVECVPHLAESGDGGSARPADARVSDAAKPFRSIQVKGVGLVKMVLGICTANVRKDWVSADAKPLMSAAADNFAAKRALDAALR